MIAVEKSLKNQFLSIKEILNLVEQIIAHVLVVVKCVIRTIGKKGNPSVLIPSNRRDQYTPFRYYFRNARKRFKDFDLSLEYLKQLWDEQKGICPYTGIHLQLAEYKANHNDPIYTASLDRIDSSKGYIKGNVQFISTAINYMKNNMSHEDTITLCKIIAKHVVELEASESLVQTTNQMT